jgi:hypothetical protein
MYFFKKILIVAVIGAAVYFLMSYHYIFIGRQVKMLKKSEFTLKYTFFSVKGRSAESILDIKDLYNDGVGQLLVDEGQMSEERLNIYEAKLKAENEE